MSVIARELQDLLGTDDSEQEIDDTSGPAESQEGLRSVDECLLVARLLFWSGRVSEADRLLRPLVRQHHQSRSDLLGLWAQIKHTEGQLTEAIHAILRMHALSPPEQSALRTLEMVHRISMHPDSGKRELELELIADDAMARAHRAQAELERAFRLASQQKFTSAVAACDRLAERQKSSDPQVYKLALLAKALFLEGVGQFDAAIQTLESLGATRGFEADKDRLLSLARAYERRAARDDLPRAAKVHAFLYEQGRASEFLSRMARVAERMGDKSEAERWENRFLEAFRRERFELSLDELLDAACLHHLPLESLRKIAPPVDELKKLRPSFEAKRGRTEDERRLALLLALAGDVEASSTIWRALLQGPHAKPVDAKYFGDIREDLGDEPGARSLYLAAVSREQVADTDILEKLFRRNDPELDRLLAIAFEDAEKRGLAYEALKQAAKGHQLSPEVWTTLARFERLFGLENDAARHQSKADALARVRARGEKRIGHVQVAAVYEVPGQKRGMVHEIWASRYRVGPGSVVTEGGQLDEGSIFGNVARDMMHDIQNVFVAVRTFVQQKFPHLVEDLGEYRYVLKVTKDDEPSGGNSAGIAVALAFVSVFLQKPLPSDFAITGSLVADSSSELRLRRIADVDYKVVGVYERRLSRLIVPEENRIDLESSCVVPRKVWEQRVAFARNLTQVMKLVFGSDVWEW